MNRRVKQFLYSIFYLVLWAGVIMGVYVLFVKPAPSCFNGIQDQGEQGVDCGGPCAKACLPATLKPLSLIDRVRVLSIDQGHTSFLVQIQNPNLDYGAKSFDYAILLYDNANNLLQSVPGSSYAYSGEIKYLAAPNLSISGAKIDHADLAITNPQWVPAEQFRQPALHLQDFTTSVTGNNLSVDGHITNQDTLSFPALQILAVFYGQFNQPAAVSETELDNVQPNETRAFTILHPNLHTINLAETKVFFYTLRP